MSIILDILQDLWDTEFNYKGVRVNFFGVQRFLIDGRNKESARNALFRLKNRGHITKNSNGWMITDSGKAFLKQKKNNLRNFKSLFNKTSPKNLLFMFDIPESRKIERSWLRRHLKKFNYAIIQKSVWVGPSSLPEDFIAYLKTLKLDSCIRTFKLSNPYKIKN